jgi:itaconyl-CoA hydratase
MNNTITGFSEILPRIYQEKVGLNYDELFEGLIIHHRPGRTVTETDNIWGSLLAMNAHPLHIDREYAKHTQFERNVVCSLVTLSIITGMTVRSMSGTAIANLGWDGIKLLAPEFEGDPLYAESEVVSKRDSGSNPKNAVVKIFTKGIKQDDTVFLESTRSFLMKKSD